MDRSAILRQIQAEPACDILVIGGGATGLGTALDAASRGYRTILVEQSDFAKATSSRSTKLIHGGVRYLRQGNLALVKGALRERALLLANAPHIVHPLSFLIPSRSWRETLFYGAGLKLYDLLAGKENLSPSRMLSAEEAAHRIPAVANLQLAGGLLYQDAQFDDARLAIALAQTAVEHGAAVVNYVRVVSLRKDAGKLSHALARDEETGAEFEISARVIINATGVFCDSLRAMDEPSRDAVVSPSQGAHLVLPKSFLPGDTAILLPQTADGRVLFAIPWNERVILGTTDTPVSRISLDPKPLRDEVDFLVSHARRYLGWSISESDILSTYAGLRPLVRVSGARKTSSLSRDHLIAVSSSGLVTVTGGKWTTYRKMAEDAVNAAVKIADLSARPCNTAMLKLAKPSSLANFTHSVPEGLLHPNLPYHWQELHRGVHDEMARTVEDLLARRTRASLLDSQASCEVAPAVAAYLAQELCKDESWRRAQVAAFIEGAAK